MTETITVSSKHLYLPSTVETKISSTSRTVLQSQPVFSMSKSHSGAPFEKYTSFSTHNLTGKWDMYYHLPQNTSWDLSSYKKILFNIETAEQVILLNDAIPENAIKTCMFFIMRSGITPLWEDPKNRKGGCFSFKILNKSVYDVWRSVFYHLAGGTLLKNRDLEKNVNGITISPKKNFCILKIWMLTTEHQNPEIVVDIPGLFKNGCIFKGHTPEY